MVNGEEGLWTAEPYVRLPLLYKGKVRELYDAGQYLLIVVTDRISAFDFVLQPPIPHKGQHLNRMSLYWFALTEPFIPNHVVHDVSDVIASAMTDPERLRDRYMIAVKTERISIECVVRGHLTGGGWRQYERTGKVNGIVLPPGLQKNEALPQPIFTPAIKNDHGHDEDISYEQLCDHVGASLAEQLREMSVRLFTFAYDHLKPKGLILADCKFEFGQVDGQLLLIDELLTPDSARLWPQTHFVLGQEIDSLDKEPVRTFLAQSQWDRIQAPQPLPAHVVEATRQRYAQVERWICGEGREHQSKEEGTR